MKGDFRPAMRRRYRVRTRRVGSGVQSGLVTLESSQSYSLACHEKHAIISIARRAAANRRSSRYASSGRDCTSSDNSILFYFYLFFFLLIPFSAT